MGFQNISGYIFAVLFLLSSCSEGSGNSSGGGATPGSTGNAGTLVIALEAKEDASSDSIANADLQVVGRPEVAAKSDASGNIVVENLSPGTLQIFVNSPEGAALSGDSKSYGLKLDDIVLAAGERRDLGKHVFKETGSLSGKVTFHSNPNNLDLTGSEVFVPGTSFITKTDAEGNFSLSRLPEGKYELRVQHTGFSVLDLKDVTVSEASNTDLGNIRLSLSTGPEGKISLVNISELTISGKKHKVATAANREVKYQLTYDSDTALMKISDEPSFLNKEWEPVASEGTWKSFSSDGPKTLYVMFSDLNGLESSPYSDDVIIDTEAPVLLDVKLLNGWAQTSQAEIFVDLVAQDNGTGVKEVLFSSDGITFSNTPRSFAEQLDLTLSSGNGSKSIYVKLRDYVGRESNVVSDDINLLAGDAASATIIAGTNYDKAMRLSKKQSPYLVKSDGKPVFLGSLTIDPGVVLMFETGAQMEVRGVFKAEGTGWGATQKITIKNEDPSTASCTISSAMPAELKLDSALPGVSQKNRIKYTHFQHIGQIHLNGGELSQNIFDGSTCASNHYGLLKKSGLDNLKVSDNTFDSWDTVMEVVDGDGNTKVMNNSGNVVTALRQKDRARNTTFTNNTLESNFKLERGLIEPLNSHAMDFSNSTFTGDGTAIYVSEFASFPLAVSDLNVDACDKILMVHGDVPLNSSITIEDSSFNCKTAIYSEGDTPVDEWAWSSSLNIIFSHVNMTVSQAVVYSSSSNGPGSVIISDSNLTCAVEESSGEFCDLYYGYKASDSHTAFTLNQNNIYCKGDTSEGCRGFVLDADEGGAATHNFDGMDFDLDGNHWLTGVNYPDGKTLQSDFESNVILLTAGSLHATEVRAFESEGAGGMSNVNYTWPSAITTSAFITEAGPR